MALTLNAGGQISITTNTTWHPSNLPPSGYEDGILIYPGVTLNIISIPTNMVFNDGITIHILSGAKLLMQGTVITFGQNNLIDIESAGSVEVRLNTNLFFNSGSSILIKQGAEFTIHQSDCTFDQDNSINIENFGKFSMRNYSNINFGDNCSITANAGAEVYSLNSNINLNDNCSIDIKEDSKFFLDHSSLISNPNCSFYINEYSEFRCESSSVTFGDFNSIKVEDNSNFISQTSILTLGNNTLFEVEDYSKLENKPSSSFNFYSNSSILIKSGSELNTNNASLNMGYSSMINIEDYSTFEMKNNSHLNFGDGSTLNISSNSEMKTEISNLTFGNNNLIEIENNSMLNINTSSNFLFGNSSKIYVKQGCFLNIDNYSTLNSSNPSSFKWQGIQTEHNQTQAQFITIPSAGNDGNCSKSQWSGVIDLGATRVFVNDSEIKNAIVGIEEMDGKGGAIIRVRNTKFIDCESGISLKHNYCRVKKNHGRNVSASYIMNCDFEWENAGSPTLEHIKLQSCDGINIGGCIFSNNIDAVLPVVLGNNRNERGIGINAFESSFSVSHDGDKCCKGKEDEEEIDCPDNCYENQQEQPRRNQFNFLSRGISFRGDGEKEFTCRKSDFNNCRRGIDITLNTAKMLIKDCSFKSDYNSYSNKFVQPGPTEGNEFIGSIISNFSSGYTIYGNTFETDFSPFQFITFYNSASGNKLYSKVKKNTFKQNFNSVNNNHITRGIFVSDDNSNLDITCNTFDNVAFDIFVNEIGKLPTIPVNYDKVNPLNGKDLTRADPDMDFLLHKNIHSASNNHIPAGAYWNIINENPNSIITFYQLAGYNVNQNPHQLFDKKTATISSNDLDIVSVDCEFICEKSKPIATSVKNISHFKQINIYPNPASEGFIHFNLESNTKKIVYKIYDSQGKLVLSNSTNENKIDINQLSNGIYFLNFTIENQFYSNKFIIQKQ